jgi:hypothetical protein
MRAAWDILEEKYPGLIMNGCGAHTINLLVKDICHLPIYREMLLKAREITQFVKKKNLLVFRFRKIQENMVAEGELTKKLELEYVGETRWYTHHRCVSRKEFIKRNTALYFWQKLGIGKYPILFQVAEIVLAIPTSQAAAERVWSMNDFIHTKRRNRLSAKKVTKLVQLYMNGGQSLGYFAREFE